MPKTDHLAGFAPSGQENHPLQVETPNHFTAPKKASQLFGPQVREVIDDLNTSVFVFDHTA